MSAATKLLLTLEDAADQLSVSRSTVYKLINDGVLRSVKVGKRRMVPTDALPECIEALAAAS